MSDPQRLLSEGSSDFERSLLRSWEGEQPSAAARASTVAIAGMSAVAAAAALKGAGGSLAPKAALGASAVAKWAALCALVVAAGGTLAYVQHAAKPAASSAPSVVIAASVAPPAPVAATEPAAPVTAPAIADTAAPVARATPSHATTPRAASTLGEQVTALDRARRALSDGDPRGALRAVDDYEARFPHGTLSEEAEVVRVEALVAAGDHAGAERAASRFLAAHPGSPHASHVRALVGQP